MIPCPLCLSAATEDYYTARDPKCDIKEYSKCLNCHLIYLVPNHHLTAQAEKVRYDFHNNSPDQKGYVDFLTKLVGPLSQKLKPGARGLDFGCGPGPVLNLLMKKRGFEMQVYDPIYFPHPKLLTEQFDFVTCSEVIEHFRFPRKEFLLMDKLMSGSGSYLGVMTQMLEREEDFSGWWYRKDPTHIAFYQKKTMEWIAEWLGWNLEVPAGNIILFSKR